MRRRVRRWLGAGLSVVLLLSVGAAAGDRPGTAGVAPPDVVYGYDELGRLAAVTDPDTGTAVYRYDPAGNIVGIDRLPAGQVPSAEAMRAEPPVVSGFSPTVVHPGEAVTISGERFTGDPMLDRVVIADSTYATVESASPSELVARMPAVASSGRVSVVTPNGTGHGGSDLFVIPWEEYGAGDVTAAVRAGLGEPVPVTLDAPGQVALVAFDGHRGQQVALDATGELECFDLAVGWSGPAAEVVIDPETGHGCGRDVPVTLPADGSYTLLVTARRDELGTATLTVTDATVAAPSATPAPAPPAGEEGRVAAADRVVDGAAVAPVDLGNGALVVEHTDLVIDDVLPVALTRGYRPRTDPAALVGRGPLGTGWQLPYTLQLQTSPALQYADLLLPDGTTLPFERTSDGTDAESAVFVPVGARNPASGGHITYRGGGFELALEDGTTLSFAGNTQAIPLVAVRDRYGNAITIEHERDSIGRAGRIVAIHSPAGLSVRFGYDDQHRIIEARDHTGRSVSYRYTADGLLAAAVSSTGAGVGYTYDDQQRITAVADTSSERPLVTVAYDGNGLVSEQRLADGSVYQFSYRVADGTIEVDGPDGEASQLEVQRITAAEVTDPTGAVRVVTFADARWTSDTYAGSTVTAERDGATGFVTGLVYPDGSRTAYAYDRAGHVTGVTETALDQQLSTGYGYDPAWHEVTSIVDSAGLETRYSYDPAGNLATVTDPDGAATGYAYDPGGRLAAVTGPDGATTGITYELNHRITVTDPDGQASSEYYDAAGWLAAVTDPLGNTTRLGYDLRDRVTSVTDPAGGVTGFAYDGGDNLVALTDAAGNTTRYEYDELGRVVSRTDPLGAVDSYRYDEAGRLVTHVDRRGVRTTYAYDELGQPTAVSYGVDDAGDAESTVTYRYDEVGQLVEVDDSAYGTIGHRYDPLGRMIAETSPAGPISYRYDEVGRLIAVVLPDGTETGYRYDEAGRLTGVGNPGAAIHASYDQAGRVTRLELPGGFTAEYGFDPRGQPTDITYRHDGDSLGDLRYAYDPAGRRSGVSGSLAGVELPAPIDQAAYDAGNRLVRHDGTTLVYDQAGNLVDDGTHTYTWDARGQLVAIDGPTQATFVYDPFGRRTAKTIDGATTTYLYDGDNLAQQTNPDGSVSTYLTGPGLDEHYAVTRNGATETYLTDIQGTVLGLAGPGGTLTGSYTISEDPLGYGAGDPNLYAHTFGDPVNYTDPTGLQATAGAGLWVCAAASGWALVESNKNIDSYNRVLETTPPLSEEQFIALDELVVRQSNVIDIWMTICSIALGMPGFGGLTAPTIGGFGRGLPALTSRFPTLTNRFPQLFGRLPSIRPTPGQLRAPGTVPRPPPRARCSFDGDTQVLMADGTTVPISDIRPGDLVQATDPATGEHGPREVTDTWVHEDKLVDLHLDGGLLVSTTEDHPFWNHTDQRWQPAATLDPDDQLVTSTGDTVTVNGFDPTSARLDAAYNLTIDGIHSYYVVAGANEVLVHNNCGIDDLVSRVDVDNLSMTQTVANHLGDITRAGVPSRPYLNSNLVLREVIAGSRPVPDPGGVPGALRWDTPGALNGRAGTWELVIDTNTNRILHFNFVTGL